MDTILKHQNGSIAFQAIDGLPLTAREEAELVAKMMQKTGSLSAGVERETTIEINGHRVSVRTSTSIEIK